MPPMRNCPKDCGVLFERPSSQDYWAKMSERHRFPAPWSVEETDCCFIVRDQNSQALAFIYFVDEPGHRSAAGRHRREERGQMAQNIAKLPGLLGAEQRWEGKAPAQRSHSC